METAKNVGFIEKKKKKEIKNEKKGLKKRKKEKHSQCKISRGIKWKKWQQYVPYGAGAGVS